MQPQQPTALDLKRLRRQTEPNEKLWDDGVLAAPWGDLSCLSQHALHAMANIMFFSHTTLVQSRTVPLLIQPGQSVVVEAPTGSGKTVAFVLPLLERIVRACDACIVATGRPILQRNVCSVVLSPTRVLARQTFLVARSLGCRYPYKIRVELCDPSQCSIKETLSHLSRAARGAGVILVGTPYDLQQFCEQLDAATAATPDEAPASSTATRKRQTRDVDAESLLSFTPSVVKIHGIEVHDGKLPFVIIVDEADTVLRTASALRFVRNFVNRLLDMGEHVDVGLFGATVMASSDAIDFAQWVNQQQEKCLEQGKHERESQGQAAERLAPKPIHRITCGNNEHFITFLRNAFLTCAPEDMLHSLIHFINQHPTKKHFIFFSSVEVLEFVHGLFDKLHKSGTRPLLWIRSLHMFHEASSDETRFAAFNAFVTAANDDGDRETQAPAVPTRREKRLTSSKQGRTKPVENKAKAVRAPTASLLLCTDIAAYGIDIRNVDYCYHFEAPATLESYVHRIGRIARMGMRGTSVLLLPTESPRPASVGTSDYCDGPLQLYVQRLNSIQPVSRVSLPPVCAPLTPMIRSIVLSTPELLQFGAKAKAALMMSQQHPYLQVTEKLAQQMLCLPDPAF